MMLMVLAIIGTLDGQDSAAVTQAFSGRSAADYNRWLHRHASEYPGLQPIHVQIDSEAAGDSERYSYHASFLDDTGTVVRKRTFRGVRDESRAMIEAPGKFLYARKSDNGDVLFVSPETFVVTVYGQSGDSMFTSTDGDVEGDGGLYFRQYVDDEAYSYRDYFEVLGGKGQLLRKVTLGCTGEGVGLQTNHPFVYSRDTTYVMHAGSYASVIDKRGKVVWQMASDRLTAVAMSNDGRVVAVTTPESLVVRNLSSGQSLSVKFPEARLLDSARAAGGRVVPSGPFAMPLVAVSDDGGLVATFRPHNMGGTGVGLLDVYTSAGAPLHQSLWLAPGMPRAMGFVGDRVAIVGDAGMSADSPSGRAARPTRTAPAMQRWLVTTVDSDGGTASAEAVSERDAFAKFTRNSIAFYAEDWLSVYRVESGSAEQRR